jgi:hypothetical protein
MPLVPLGFAVQCGYCQRYLAEAEPGYVWKADEAARFATRELAQQAVLKRRWFQADQDDPVCQCTPHESGLLAGIHRRDCPAGRPRAVWICCPYC